MSAMPATRSADFHLAAAPTRVFPLFTAEGERAWAPGWEPEMLSGAVERGSVFRTRQHERDVVWVVTHYDAAAHRVGYARLVEGMNMGLVDVECAADGDGTRVTVRYTLTPVTAAGAQQVTQLLEAQHYAEFIDEWRVAISRVLGNAK